MNKDEQQQGKAPLPAKDLERLRKLVDANSADGEKQAAERLGIPRGTLARVLAGFSVRAGTAALIRERLAASGEAS